MPLLRLVGNQDRHTNWTAGLQLGEDRVVSPEKALEISDSERKALEAKGYEFEEVSKAEASQVTSGPVAATDVTGSAPILGSSDEPNQNVDVPGEDEKSNDRRK